MPSSDAVEGYRSSLEHLAAELERLDVLIRFQVWRARQRARDDDALRASYIAEGEPEELLDRVLGTPSWVSTPVPRDLLDAAQCRLDGLHEETARRVAASTRAGVPLRLLELAELFELTGFDVDVVLTCVAPEVDRRYRRLYGYLHDDVTQQQPTLELALDLLCSDLSDKIEARARLGATAPLRANQLLEPGEVLRLAPRVTRYLLDDDAVDDDLRRTARLVDPTVDLDALVLRSGLRDQLAALLNQARTGARPLVAYLQGPYGVGKRSVAEAWARQLGRRLLVVDGRSLATRTGEEFADQLVRLDREARLQGALLFWEAFDALTGDEHSSQLAAAQRLLEDRRDPTLLAGGAAWEPVDALHSVTFVRLELPRPDDDERLRLWHRHLDGDGDGGDRPGLQAVAGMFRLTGGQIRDAAAAARSIALARDPAEPRVTEADLFAACRLQSNPKLAQLAQKLAPHFSWDDIVLPPDQRVQLQEIADQVRHRAVVYDAWGFGAKLSRGKGINALFVGPPGTGKTMAADVLAHTLGLDLYRIDLSAVVSKYIGETEKNLSRIFEEAETSNAILFFDEADALFGKRTQVRDAHDRYANVEVSYLLQRMEEYEGVVVLATNLRQNVDAAFIRRLDFIVEFPFPNADERHRIWSQIWPTATPRGADVDLVELAERVEVTGGSIRNIAVASAFLAAADGGTVTRRHVARATQREYQKIGKVLTGREFETPA
jgi:SpoVK/Ycf46/Vps4 family AAA+-type ATPase